MEKIPFTRSLVRTTTGVNRIRVLLITPFELLLPNGGIDIGRHRSL